jgi:MinD-like ATPase involved in chromosome partitioning or flagellar assembly
MLAPDAHMPRINLGMVYLGACLIAGIRLARERQVNVRVVPTSRAIEESVDLAHEIYNRVLRKTLKHLSREIIFLV